MAPFAPFICEKMYQDLKKCEDEKDQLESVHYSIIPGEKPIYAHDKSEKEKNENEQIQQVKDKSNILRVMNSMQRVILLRRQIRDKEFGISLKIPLERVVAVTHSTQERNYIEQLAEYVKYELNGRLFQTRDANEFVVDETTRENASFLQLICQIQSSIGKKAKIIFDEERTKGIGYNGKTSFYSEDDYSVCISGSVMAGKEGIIACSVDNNGCFTREVDDYAGRYVKECDKDIIKSMKGRKILIKTEQITHSYPHCRRIDSPLINTAALFRFVNVERIKSECLQSYIKIGCSEEYNAKIIEKKKEKQTENQIKKMR
ncbi:MAG: hypothetical protein EZS28_032031 [Streblomastix strix]|uniref:Methionyl/Valyl/Leucyl/Isoleucyl-tRNA synthetase anticodon-binding domain-containing protein n=1 Tax=Streblomastix strix TaxID=222440 RepID=A0A5J4UQY9_9EUKA|nr:MAG: hypothetical protein EZS28_032031 [Streblomastix strix]